MANKQLRLDVAQLTDVGRRREHNEDNMAYVIPKDPEVMAKKGALFIVADGMGGHAAGEVASEIAVDTVSNVYYQDDSDDVATSLLHAIKRANTLIHQRAAENMLRSGMGTTCVAAVLRGNMAYVANVGDSRAYLIRGNLINQISQDHSWVAEQVRAGLLTEDQARTHAQRNVITRSLGTQSDVEIDVFSEPLEEGDRLILCTDGLSGLVSEEEMRNIATQSPPQESVYHLIEKANENGGPDNITAIVVAVEEVGVEPPSVRRPVPAGYVNGNETSENTVILGLPLASSSPAFSDGRAAANSLRAPSGPLISPESISATQPPTAAKARKRSRLFYPTAALLILLIAALLASGAYFYLFVRSNTSNNAGQKLANSQKLISQAQAETVSNPPAALHDLASAQSMLLALVHDNSLSTQQHNKALGILQGSFTQAVKSAIISYNQQEHILPVDCLSASTSVVGTGSTNTQPQAVALIQVAGKPSLFALGTDSKLYQINMANTSLIPYPLPSTPANAQVKAITAYNGTQLALLVFQPEGSQRTSYSLAILAPDQKKITSSTTIPLGNAQAPALIAASGQDIYVELTSNSSQVSILDYAPSTSGNHALQSPASSTFSVSANIVSMAAFPNHLLFFLLQSGLVQSLQFASGERASTSVFVQQVIPQPLPVSAQRFTWQTILPPVTTASSKALTVPGATSQEALVASVVNNVSHLYIMDAVLHRILDLQPSSLATRAASATPGASATASSAGGGTSNGSNATTSTLQVVQQYASPTLFAQLKSMGVDPQGATIDVLSQNSSSSLNLVSFNVNARPQSNCG